MPKPPQDTLQGARSAPKEGVWHTKNACGGGSSYNTHRQFMKMNVAKTWGGQRSNLRVRPGLVSEREEGKVGHPKPQKLAEMKF